MAPPPSSAGADQPSATCPLDGVADSACGALGRLGVDVIFAAITAAMPAMPSAFGWTGAACRPLGMIGSTQRVPFGWQASWPMPGVYTSTYRAPLATAWAAIIAFSSLFLARSHGR